MVEEQRRIIVFKAVLKRFDTESLGKSDGPLYDVMIPGYDVSFVANSLLEAITVSRQRVDKILAPYKGHTTWLNDVDIAENDLIADLDLSRGDLLEAIDFDADY